MSPRRKLILFFGFLLLVPVIANWVAAGFFRGDATEALIDRAVSQNPPYLAFGTSRTAAGLEPRIFDEQIVILSAPFMDIQMLDLITDKHMSTLKKSGQVYLEYYPEMFFIQTIKNEPEAAQSLARLQISFWRYGQALLNPSHWQVGTIFPFLTQIRLTPRMFLSDQRDTLRHSETAASTSQVTGYLPRRHLATEAELAATSKEIAKKIAKYENREAEAQGIARFQKVDQKLRQAGVNYCWLKMPMSAPLKASREKSRRRIEAEISAILEEKSCLTANELEVFEKSAKFSDASHLQAEGAIDFSKALRKKNRN